MVVNLHPVFLLAVALIVAKWLAELWLDTLNRRHVLAHAGKVPPAFESIIDALTYDKSVRYTLAKNSLSHIETTYDTIILLLIIGGGILPLALKRWTDAVGNSAWAMAGFLFAVGVVLSLMGLPLAWYSQFRLEERFGFNTTTPKVWWMDRLKGLLLALVLGYPLLVLILKLIEWTGSLWWFWAWACMMAFQLLMLVLAPVLILPLFNKFTPLPEGSLRQRLLALGTKTAFPARNIQVMDGSKRSRHSNAFFTGFGRFRKIVLFDTLLAQLTEAELEAVLAHEIGHYKKRHIAKMLAWSAAFSLAGFYVLAWLARQEWFYRAFGFQPGNFAAALLLFALLAGTLTFWLSPLANYWSRRHEYQADAYAAKITGEVASLTGALRKLNEKNLSNLTPHPIFSGFYYSHPTLLERENALGRLNLERAESRLVGTT
jgi:STE24 endopeptidase